MSATNCEDPRHEERCEKCGGCVLCGCLCHLAGEEVFEETPEGEAANGLVPIEFGLQPFQYEAVCPKCNSTGVRISYHSCLILNTGTEQLPCGSWYRSGILTGDIGEHLCMRCSRCQYGWPTQTADAYRLHPAEDQDDPEELT